MMMRVLCAMLMLTAAARAQVRPGNAENRRSARKASNMRLVGYDTLQARSAYQPTIHKQGDRYIAYVGHHGGTNKVAAPVNPLTGKQEPNGTSLVDVTDPAHPKYFGAHSR